MIYIMESEPQDPEQGTLWIQTHPSGDSRLDNLWTRVGNTWVYFGPETKFDRADNYDTMLREINERGERIKKLGEELKLAYFEGFEDGLKSDSYGMDHDACFNLSRAKRVAEGLE